jgi:hypothetical protein
MVAGGVGRRCSTLAYRACTNKHLPSLFTLSFLLNTITSHACVRSGTVLTPPSIPPLYLQRAPSPIPLSLLPSPFTAV